MFWLLEKITLSLLMLLQRIQKNSQDDHFNTCKLEQSESEGRPTGPLPQGSKHQSAKYAASTTRGTRESLLKFIQGCPLPRQFKKEHYSYSVYLCKSIFAWILHTEASPPLERGNDLPGEHDRSGNWSCVMINHLSSFPCMLFHSSCKRFMHQTFPHSDPQALDLSNRPRTAVLSLADLQMHLVCRSCTFLAISSVPSKKICILILRLYTSIKYHKVNPVTLNIILFSSVLYTKFLSLYVTLNHF